MKLWKCFQWELDISVYIGFHISGKKRYDVFLSVRLDTMILMGGLPQQVISVVHTEKTVTPKHV